ncbi:MAG TPA: ABC transporter substrate-binding protein [Anaerolineales bacterium]|jgi:multiple sugar transport system substrate-binding protein|nr:ABC transporter substrate-binding protein [Anaerolineales bacterium]
MKSFKNRLWGLMCILVITGLLAACGAPAATQAPATSEPEEPADTPTPETVFVEITSTPQPGTVQYNPDVSGDIELWHFWASPVRRNGVQRIKAICEQKLPNITVTDTVKPFGDIWTANVAAVAAGSGMPDVIVSDRPTLPRDAADGVYMSLQEFADRDGITRDQFYDWAWDQTLFEGQTYGIPFETDVRVLFWNKQLFEEAGLDPNKPPTTWDELLQYADALDKKNADGTYDRIAFFPLWNAGFNPFWAYLNGAPLIDAEGNPVINSPEAAETLEWIKMWVDRYGGWQALKDYQAKFGAPPNDLFMGNGVAMLVDIFGYNSQLEFYRPRADTNGDGQITGDDPRMDWGIGMLPYNEAPADWSGGFSLSIPAGAENPEAAWEFIKCMTGPEGQTSWARDTQAQPTNLIAAKDPVLSASPGWEVVDQALQVSTGGTYLSGYPNWNEQLDLVLEQVWTGELSPQEALDQAQAAVEDAIQ